MARKTKKTPRKHSPRNQPSFGGFTFTPTEKALEDYRDLRETHDAISRFETGKPTDFPTVSEAAVMIEAQRQENLWNMYVACRRVEEYSNGLSNSKPYDSNIEPKPEVETD